MSQINSSLHSDAQRSRSPAARRVQRVVGQPSQLEHVGAGVYVPAWDESEPLEEAAGRFISSAKAEQIESFPGIMDHLPDEVTANASSPQLLRHIKVPDSASLGICGVGILIQTTDANQSALSTSHEECFAMPLDAVGPVVPLVGKASQETIAKNLTLPQHLVKLRDDKNTDRLDGYIHSCLPSS